VIRKHAFRVPKSEIESSSADRHEETLISALIPYPRPHRGPAPGAPPDVGGAIPVEVQPSVDPAVHKVDTKELSIDLTMIGRHSIADYG
jgi:hypothetical protein